jgi:CubicO group peptidase (beta-lactamase class C family)
MSSPELQSPPTSLRAILAGGQLPAALRVLSRRHALSLEYLVDDQRGVLAPEPSGPATEGSEVDIGCIAKNVTALLFAVAASEGKLAYSDCVSSFFPQVSGRHPSLRVHHLLNHSHGLDGSMLENVPYAGSGYIDSDAIWNEVTGTPAISPPGTLYYYFGNSGIWLAAAILERVYDCTYSVLFRRLMHRIGISRRHEERGSICPATGGIRLSCADLLTLCAFHLRNHEDHRLTACIGELRNRYHLDLPRQWPRVADSVTPGWFLYGRTFGWFGKGRGSSSLILISPDEQAAISLTARAQRTIRTVQGALFGNLLNPGRIRAPRPLTRIERLSLRSEGFTGRYGKASLVLDISGSGPRGFQASVYRRDGAHQLAGAPIISRLMVPATNNVLYPTAPEPTVIPYVTFSGEEQGRYCYAMTGKHVFRRVDP